MEPQGSDEVELLVVTTFDISLVHPIDGFNEKLAVGGWLTHICCDIVSDEQPAPFCPDATKCEIV